MPRKAKAAPTQFLSDDEGEEVVEQQSRSSPPAPSVSDADDIPPAPKQQAGRLARVYTLPGDDNNVDPPRTFGPPLQRSKLMEEPAKANIADLVAILTSSNASMKGRVDDTGRFELEFELNRDNCHHGNRDRRSFDRTPSPVAESFKSVSPLARKTHGAKPGKRLVGWTR